MSPDTTDLDGIGVYVHFPWCLKKCPYCDFLSVAVPSESGQPLSAAAAREKLPHEEYADAVIAELEARAQSAWHATPLPRLRSVFFGGGTPSLWDVQQLGRVLKAIRRIFGDRSDPDLEITVECNPTSLEEPQILGLLKAGVNRLSIGVQGLENERLQFLGRLHDERGGLAAIERAVRLGVPRVSGDLIFGVHQQTPSQAVEEVQRVADTGVQHLSAYSLTIEPGTRFGALDAQKRLPLLDDALVAESFHAVSEALTTRGFEHYEISNFARPDEQSRHNLGYWLGRDYLGLGTGAYGTVALADERIRYRNLLSPERYVAAFTAASTPGDPFHAPLADREELSGEEAVQEALMLGLRVGVGVDLSMLEILRGAPTSSQKRSRTIARLLAEGRLERVGDRLRLPRCEWIFADRTIRDLL